MRNMYVCVTVSRFVQMFSRFQLCTLRNARTAEMSTTFRTIHSWIYQKIEVTFYTSAKSFLWRQCGMSWPKRERDAAIRTIYARYKNTIVTVCLHYVVVNFARYNIIFLARCIKILINCWLSRQKKQRVFLYNKFIMNRMVR